MAGLCSYNFTVGFSPISMDILSDGEHKLEGIFGKLFDSFYSSKNEW